MQEWIHEGRPELHRGHDRAPEGPWWSEPDKRHWVDPETDLDCLMVRNHFGAWCGYVAVTQGRPCFKVDYDECYDKCELVVHGGLTFASFCREAENGEGFGICHVPLPGRPDRVWWLGFDCGHFMDFQPLFDMALPGDLQFGGYYRDVAYVEAEVTSLAKQLAAVR